jgi:hypothetical protein
MRMAGEEYPLRDAESRIVTGERIHSCVRIAHRSGKKLWPSVVRR